LILASLGRAAHRYCTGLRADSTVGLRPCPWKILYLLEYNWIQADTSLDFLYGSGGFGTKFLYDTCTTLARRQACDGEIASIRCINLAPVPCRLSVSGCTAAVQAPYTNRAAAVQAPCTNRAAAVQAPCTSRAAAGTVCAARVHSGASCSEGACDSDRVESTRSRVCPRLLQQGRLRLSAVATDSGANRAQHKAQKKTRAAKKHNTNSGDTNPSSQRSAARPPMVRLWGSQLQSGCDPGTRTTPVRSRPGPLGSRTATLAQTGTAPSP